MTRFFRQRAAILGYLAAQQPLTSYRVAKEVGLNRFLIAPLDRVLVRLIYYLITSRHITTDPSPSTVDNKPPSFRVRPNTPNSAKQKLNGKEN